MSCIALTPSSRLMSMNVPISSVRQVVPSPVGTIQELAFLASNMLDFYRFYLRPRSPQSEI
ncbi:MAG: hypothetical protein QF773_07030 [Lentisphaeria bacterium]|jgi:hypothetical protein|nr:hypothetical protein [Lentisphaeria bacterium]